MLSIESYLAYEILEKFFKGKCKELLRGSQSELLRYLELNMKLDKTRLAWEDELKTFQEASQDELQGFMLFFIYKCSKKKTEYENHLYYWLARVNVNLQCDLPLELKEETVYYLCRHSYSTPIWDLKRNGKEDLTSNERSDLLLGLLKNFPISIMHENIENLINNVKDQSL